MNSNLVDSNFHFLLTAFDISELNIPSKTLKLSDWIV